MIVFDTETTGLVLPLKVPIDQQPQVVEFAAVKLDAKLKEVGMIEFICNPYYGKTGRTLPHDIVKITGLTDKDIADKKPFSFHYPDLCDFFLGEKVLVAHNCHFDSTIIELELKRMDKATMFPWPSRHICTVEASFPIEKKRLNLSALYKIATKGGEFQAHRAINDVRANAVCIRYLVKEGYIKL